MSYSKHFPWIGVVLMLAGLALLLNKLDILTVGTPTLLWVLCMLFGIAMVAQGFSTTNGARIFFGTLFFLYGLYFILHSIDAFEMRSHLFIPASFLIFGFAFVMIYLNNFREWILLLPAVLLMGIGTLYIMGSMGYFNAWEMREMVRLYWPVGLIIIGLAIVLRRRTALKARAAAPADTQPPPPVG